MIFASHLFERELPRLRGTGLKHRFELSACRFRSKEAATVQWAFVPRGVTHRLIELKLINACEIIAGVGHIGWDMILRAGIEVCFRAGDRRSDTLVLFTQGPP